MRTCRLVLLIALGLAPAISKSAEAPPNHERVLVVYNAFSKDSREVARHYARARHIPEANLCALGPVEFNAGSGAPIVYIAYDEFQRVMARPIRRCLNRAGKRRILYLVLTFGTPYRLRGVPDGAGVAIDSYLSDLWNLDPRSPEPNPYYEPFFNKQGTYPAFVPLDEYRRRPKSRLIYSVWRLDGATAPLASSLVDKAMEAERKGLGGIACFDRRKGGDNMEGMADVSYDAGEWDIFRAAQFAREAGFEVVEDAHPEEFGTAPAPPRCDGAALYAGWYSLDHYNDVFTWNAGAIGLHLDSDSAANPRGGRNWSANALQRGITVTSGALAEPYLTGLPHPAGIFRNLFEGASVGDAFLRNTALLRWQIVNLGDPLYTPFPGGRGLFAKKK